jgi:putative addiction module CopG family antidote
MPKHIRADDLPEDLARFAEAEIAAGHFANIEEVLRAGKEALEHEQRRRERHEAKLAGIDAALEEGERSGMFEGNPFDSVRARHGLPRRPAEKKSLAQLFAESPLKGLDLQFERDKDMGRPIRL